LDVDAQESVEGGREVANADAGGVIHGVGDRCGGADDADLTDPLGT
jgi:hypothetical protein